MKKVVALVLLLVAVLSFEAFAESMRCDSITGTGQVYTGKGKYYGVKVLSDGTNNVTLALYDNTTNSIVLDASTVYTTSETKRVETMGYYPPLLFNTGIYAVVTCSGTTTIMVCYEPR